MVNIILSLYVRWVFLPFPFILIINFSTKYKNIPSPFPCLGIVNRKSCIDLETSIVPMATLEMGLIEADEGNHERAKEWLDKAEKDFSGYTAENFVHIKVYAAIRRMGYKTDKRTEDKEKCKLS